MGFVARNTPHNTPMKRRDMMAIGIEMTNFFTNGLPPISVPVILLNEEGL